MGLDSVELVQEIEISFGIVIPDEVAENLTTVGKMYDAVWGRLKDGISNISSKYYTGTEAESRKIIEDIVKNIIINKLGVEEHEVVPAARFVHDLGVD